MLAHCYNVPTPLWFYFFVLAFCGGVLWLVWKGVGLSCEDPWAELDKPNRPGR